MGEDAEAGETARAPVDQGPRSDADAHEHAREASADGRLPVEDLGRMPYAEAFERQREAHAAVLAARDTYDMDDPAAPLGRLLLVEHVPPVITVSRRPDAAQHLLASADLLEQLGVQVEPTDRGGDITYHGPGQLVAYPIIDLNRARLRLHDYMRLLEQSVIDACGELGLATRRDPDATGVWCDDPRHPRGAKLCAIGVRVRRWVSMHGLALNVTTNLDHFKLIVPCGLAGRPVTSLEEHLDVTPAFDVVQATLVDRLRASLVAWFDEKWGAPTGSGTNA